MRLKDDSVNPFGMRPELMLALLVADDEYRTIGIELVITSLNDAAHSEKSKHYQGAAADLRTRTLPEEVSPESMGERIRRRLNKHYDVVVEPTHIHIEYDPRRP